MSPVDSSVPLWSIAREVRRVVEPRDLGEQVVHYSIPSVDATGGGLVEDSSTIQSSKFHLFGDELLVSKLNPRKTRVVEVQRHELPAVGSTEFISLVPWGCDRRFLGYLLKSEATRQELDSRVQSVTRSHQRVSPEEVLRLPVKLPPRDEQRRIADFLDNEATRIDATVRVRKKGLNLLLDRRVSNVIHQVSGAKEGNLERATLPWLRFIPEAWQEVRLGLLAKMGSGHTPSRSRPEWWLDCTIPWITTGEVSQVRDDRREEITETRERISEIGLANSSAEIHPKGTVVLCRTASAGYSAVMGTDMATSQDFVTWTCGPRLDPYYLLWCLRAMRDDLLGRLAMGSTHKTIYVPDLQMLRIPLPGIDEQKRIVRGIRKVNEDIDRAADSVKRQIELLEERKRALITAVVTGQIDVTTARGADVS